MPGCSRGDFQSGGILRYFRNSSQDSLSSRQSAREGASAIA